MMLSWHTPHLSRPDASNFLLFLCRSISTCRAHLLLTPEDGQWGGGAYTDVNFTQNLSATTGGPGLGGGRERLSRRGLRWGAGLSRLWSLVGLRGAGGCAAADPPRPGGRAVRQDQGLELPNTAPEHSPQHSPGPGPGKRGTYWGTGSRSGLPKGLDQNACYLSLILITIAQHHCPHLVTSMGYRLVSIGIYRLQAHTRSAASSTFLGSLHSYLCLG